MLSSVYKFDYGDNVMIIMVATEFPSLTKRHTE